MAGTPYRTVSEEMAWTDWSEAGTPRTAAAGRRWVGLAAALVVVAAMLAAVIFLLPPSIS